MGDEEQAALHISQVQFCDDYVLHVTFDKGVNDDGGFCGSRLLNLDKMQSASVNGNILNEFISDSKTQYAVCKALGNMGEASKRIPESIRKKYPQISFRQMAGLRDVVTHDYDGISYDIKKTGWICKASARLHQS